ncbi:tRNA lysidine(34) synthetase TilS [Flavobacterium supellecticarium]|uniref:tRNA(Ile)-lysidine synthase n=1 Tax=Flavobacterium supellecticarium TaxID=2565924 RepID=A0A4S3ZQT3_9FLAO|nr:tRNA lysidine(34) synthetase TilS [Flavobacterium supellecticarium]THF47937.1 tRNA lysidine(34) synthetase TilS [Flavobacterium supellecticarium]
MRQQLQQHLNDNFAFLQGKQLLLAISGGIDSMVLLELFRNLPYTIAVAHCNFGLRAAESDGDEDFVKQWCAKNNIRFFTTRFATQEYAETEKCSIQLAARELRYNWFSALLENEGFDYLLTAHHLDDTLETFLINLTRGTGLDGLTGIPAQNGTVIRPLLPFGRDEIEAYAVANSIAWREDSSNASDKYLRNRIRHQVVPILKELNPNFLNGFQDTLVHLQQTESLVQDAVTELYSKIVTEKEEQLHIAIEKLKLIPNYKAYLYQWLKPYGFTAWDDIYNLINAQSGKQVFSENYRLLKDRDYLLLEKQQVHRTQSIEITENQEVTLEQGRLTLYSVTNVTEDRGGKVIFVDKDKLKLPLILRKWKEGDYFYPSGMTGRKKISKYFKDEKFSLIDKENCWLLCSGDEIVWVVGKRSDRRFEIEQETNNIIKIELQLL